MNFKRGGVYRHKNCLDIDLYVEYVDKVQCAYIDLYVIYIYQKDKDMWLKSDKVRIKRKNYKDWKFVR